MRCCACDKELVDHEVKRKGLFSREYIDLCDLCYVTISDDVPLATGNEQLDASLRQDYTHPTTTDLYDDGHDVQD